MEQHRKLGISGAGDLQEGEQSWVSEGQGCSEQEGGKQAWTRSGGALDVVIIFLYR